MNTQLRKFPKLFFLASMVSLVAFAACDKDDDGSPKPTGSGKVALLNAAFGADSLNLFVDAKKASKKLLGYSDSLNYIDVTTGDRAFEIKGKDDKSLLKKSIAVEKDRNYSLLATNSKDGKTFEFVQVTDDLTAPKTDKAKVRLIHLSPDAGKLNLVTGETKLAENIAYKNASAFKEVDAKKTSFDIVDPEAEETVLTVNNLELTKGKIYTIWITGLQETDDVKKEVKAHIFVNR